MAVDTYLLPLTNPSSKCLDLEPPQNREKIGLMSDIFTEFFLVSEIIVILNKKNGDNVNISNAILQYMN